MPVDQSKRQFIKRGFLIALGSVGGLDILTKFFGGKVVVTRSAKFDGSLSRELLMERISNSVDLKAMQQIVSEFRERGELLSIKEQKTENELRFEFELISEEVAEVFEKAIQSQVSVDRLAGQSTGIRYV